MNMVKTITTLFFVNILIIFYFIFFGNLKEMFARSYANLIDYFSYIDNILLWVLLILAIISSVLMIIYVFRENRKEI